MNHSTTAKPAGGHWELADGYEHIVIPLETALATNQYDIVKESSARHVYAIDLQEMGQYYVKQYNTPTLTDKTRFLFSKSKGSKEWDMLRLAREAGVACPVPVAHFEKRAGAALQMDWIVTLAVEGSVPFKDWLEANYDCFQGGGSLSDKRKVMDALALCLSGFLQSGFLHHDLHPGNILFRKSDSTCAILDFADVEFSESADPATQVKSLQQFCAYFQLYASRVDRARFFRTLCELMRWPEGVRKSLARSLEAAAESWNLTFWHKRRRRAFETNKDYRRFESDDLRGVYLRGQGLPTDMFSDALVILNGNGEVLKDGRTARVVAGEMNLTNGTKLSVVLKSYKPKKRLNIVKDLFRASRAARCWQASLDFELRGFHVPKAYAYAERGSGETLIQSMFLMKQLPGTPKLYEYIQEISQKEDTHRRRRMIANFAAEIAKMHRRGLYHGDLKGDNVFVENGQIPRFIFIDIDRAKVRKQFSMSLAVRDLSQLNREYRKWISPSQRLRFFKHYLRHLGGKTKNIRRWVQSVTDRTKAK